MSDSEECERWNTRFASEDYVFGTTPDAVAVIVTAMRYCSSVKDELCISDGFRFLERPKQQ